MFNASGKISIIPFYFNVHLKQFKIYFGKTFGKNGIFSTFTKFEIDIIIVFNLFTINTFFKCKSSKTIIISKRFYSIITW